MLCAGLTIPVNRLKPNGAECIGRKRRRKIRIRLHHQERKGDGERVSHLQQREDLLSFFDTHLGFTTKFFPLPPSRTVSFFLSRGRAFLISDVVEWEGDRIAERCSSVRRRFETRREFSLRSKSSSRMIERIPQLI